MPEMFKTNFPQQTKMQLSMLEALAVQGHFYITMVNRPKNLAEGAGADCLLLVICKEGSGQMRPTHTVLV